MSTTETHDAKTSQTSRKRWMRILALSNYGDIKSLSQNTFEYAYTGEIMKFEYLRSPEIALIMVKGRIGGSGAPFNLGEMPVTRCSVVVQCSTDTQSVGHAVISGRHKAKAELCAKLDALLQIPEENKRLEYAVIQPLEARLQDIDQLQDQKTAATKVDFFTMVRGD